MEQEKDTKISVNFVIRNGIIQGYPFWESLKSCLPFASEIVISEGYSDDETYKYVVKFASIFSGRVPIRIYRDSWQVKHSLHGEVISQISERNQARCLLPWVYYLQADEVVHEASAPFLVDIARNHPEFNAVSFRFNHFIGSWIPHEGAAYKEAIRMVRNRRDITFMGDAWNFHGAVAPVCPAGLCPKPIYHLGWVFPKSSDRKSVEHGKIYAGLADYQKTASDAKERLAKNEYISGLPKGEFDDFPSEVRRMIGLVEYRLPPEALT